MARIQYGTANTADFSECTWTFDMIDDFTVSAGTFAVIKCDKLGFQNKLEHLMSIIEKYTIEEIENKLP